MSSAARRVAALVLARASADSPVLALGIDGRSGSGKTSLATLVVAELEAEPGYGGRVVLVRLDDHYPGWSGLLAGVEAVRPLLAALRSGAPGCAPTWDWSRGAPGADRQVPGPGARWPRIVVIEGCGTSLLHEDLDALVWLDEPEPVRRARAEAREGDVTSWWGAWAEQELAADRIAPPDGVADLWLTADD